MNSEQAKKILIDVAKIAQSKGSLSLQDAAITYQAIEVLTKFKCVCDNNDGKSLSGNQTKPMEDEVKTTEEVVNQEVVEETTVEETPVEAESTDEVVA